MNLRAWLKHSLWKNPQQCIADFVHTEDGTLANPRIGETGRKFLAKLLTQLSDRQIGGLFRVGRADQRYQSENALTIQALNRVPNTEWVRVFTAKREQIVQLHCAD